MSRITLLHLFRTLLLVVFIFQIQTSYAQRRKQVVVPDTVKKALQMKFPDAIVSAWENEGTLYEAELEYHKKFFSVLIDHTGKILNTEEAIDPALLPEGIKNYIVKNLKGKKVRDAAKITDAAGRVSYQADIAGLEYVFDTKGNLLKAPL